MTRPVLNECRVSGEYVYINETCIQFDNEQQARDFLITFLLRSEVLSD